MTELIEADIQSPPNDHWADYTKDHGDPYPATQEAWGRLTEPVPAGDAIRPAEAMTDAEAYASAPWRYATPVRVISGDQWGGNGFLLADGTNRPFRIAEDDPHRVAVTVFNHSDGDIFVAPVSAGQAGAGAVLIPGRDTTGNVHSREIRSTKEVWCFTTATYIAGVRPVQVQTLYTRHGLA